MILQRCLPAPYAYYQKLVHQVFPATINNTSEGLKTILSLPYISLKPLLMPPKPSPNQSPLEIKLALILNSPNTIGEHKQNYLTKWTFSSSFLSTNRKSLKCFSSLMQVKTRRTREDMKETGKVKRLF